ncbi:MAG: hypothetical protein HUJ65_04780, partial [Oscillospiraceae bacterium]|nr:hypothetical protein [Oscillospiraceae bacterium]
MKIRKLIAALLTFAVLMSSLAVMALAAGPEEPIESNGLPYCITVNRRTNTATVYAPDDSGYYTVPVRG